MSNANATTPYLNLDVAYQEQQSKKDLLLRFFFGIIYIQIPHMVLLVFHGLAAAVLGFIAFWIVLFTGRYPENWFNYQVKLMRWQLRLAARNNNLRDGYPAFGTEAVDEAITLEVEYPEKLSQGMVLVKAMFGGIYVGIPHGFMLLFRMIGAFFLQMLGFWVVLFTGKIPLSWHNYLVGTIRWQTRFNLYMNNMTDEYPPFYGRP